MNLTKIYKAIDEGLKLSLIDFGNNKILKSDNVDFKDNEKELIDKVNKLLESGSVMPKSLYNELCKYKNIGIYTVDNCTDLLHIIEIITKTNRDINLNWIDVSKVPHFIIKDDYFYDYYSLNMLYWNLEKINNNMFAGNKALVKIILPDSITEIGLESFCECHSLLSINIPDKVLIIRAAAFSNCKRLEKVIIPSSVQIILSDVFYNCEWLNCVLYKGTVSLWKSISLHNGWNSYSWGLKVIHCIDGDIELK